MQDIGTGLLVACVIIGLLDLALFVWALVDLIRRPQTSGLPKWTWVIVILVFDFLGPIVYLLLGRQQAPVLDEWRTQATGQQYATPPRPGDGGAGSGAYGATAAPGGAGGPATDAAAETARTDDAAAGRDAVPAAPEAPEAPDAPEWGRSRAEQAVDTLYGKNEAPK